MGFLTSLMTCLRIYSSAFSINMCHLKVVRANNNPFMTKVARANNNPFMTKVVRANNNPFMTKDLRKAIMKRSKLKNEFNKQKSYNSERAYRKQRNSSLKERKGKQLQ